MSLTRLDIAVCTFRRPQLIDTLRSLARLDLRDDVSLRIVVADNDETPSAKALVDGFRAESGLAIVYVHAPARNICIARNACLDESDADFLAFIDDDEIATPQWASELLRHAGNADVVLGPVRAIYAEDAPGWMRHADSHSTFPVFVGGVIRTGYTCNVLLRRESPHVKSRRFRLELGQTGGEDTDYFDGVTESGGRIAYAENAWVSEDVPATRARFEWLAKRRFRMGQTHGRLLKTKAGGARRGVQLCLAAAKVGYSLLSAGLTAPVAAKRNRNMLRAVMHAGTIGGLLGVKELRLYAQPAPLPAERNS
ncbi:glycosyltransferase [Mesorhizobium sp. RP14(2022)]|uniref:Glycosyltransferase n=1 Tax=Mesorhizobium liriopis TaxID=2953882 RepID=A0ABT1C4M2_9HYPH|nr:glycosyltransferase family 2 protein [Mesorhizobium liriopis]MCO6049160.1 glycosyltransferase [Mesorhizobium liriopis]